MLGRIMAPAIEKMAAIDINKFIGSIICSEAAIRSAIFKLKQQFLGGPGGII